MLARAADGACVVRYSTSSFAPVAALAASADLRLHGSATAVPWRDGTYVGLFHTVSEHGALSPGCQRHTFKRAALDLRRPHAADHHPMMA